MIFEPSELEFKILDVFKLSRTADQKPGVCRGRPFASLSCRLSGYSELESKGKRFRASTENCLFIGAGAKFTHFYNEEEVVVVHLSLDNASFGIELIPCGLPEIRERFLALYSTWTAKGAGYVLKCKSILYEIFYLFCAEQDSRQEREKIKPSMDYLYSEYMNEDFSTEKMIAHSYISPAYFRRIFKSIYGTSIVKFVNSLRIEYAKALMTSRKYTVGELARLAGFSDEKYFSRIFKHITGLSPSEYKI